MSRTVTALYESREQADGALRALKAEIALAHAEIYDPTAASMEALQRLDLTPHELTVCERKLGTGDYMLLAQVESGEDPDQIITVLERVAGDDSAAPDSAPFQAGMSAREDAPPVIAEERLPVVEEELRVGTREVVRGGAKVSTRVEELPVTQEVELIEEFTRVEKRPATRPVSDQELEQAGLLRERVIEIAQVREEAVINKEAFVREEVVVTKTTERRVQQIHETLRHTEVETEDLGADSTSER